MHARTILPLIVVAMLLNACPVPPSTTPAIDGDDPGNPNSARLSLCNERGPLTLPFSDDLSCRNEVGEWQWDVFAFNLDAGDCVHVVADNIGSGDADLIALAQDASGFIYGLADDFSQLDDEIDCTNTPWSNAGCPDAAVEANMGGLFFVALAQWGGPPTGEHCADGLAGYQLHIAINGIAQDLEELQSENDVPLD